MKRIALTVGETEAGERLDRFLAGRGGITRGRARRAIDAGGVFLDGKRFKMAGWRVRPGQRVVAHLPAQGLSVAPAPLEPRRLLHCDDDLVAVDKPAGVATQPTRATDRGTLDALASALAGAPLKLVHRLDQQTSGVVVLARSSLAAATLGAALRRREAKKTYLALTAAAPDPAEGRVAAALGPDPRRRGSRRVVAQGERAATRYRTLARGRAALVEACPETGRQHQIRVHLAHLGAPILGDERYGGPAVFASLPVPRLMLHAQRLAIAHPRTGQPLLLEAPLPADFVQLATALVGPLP